MDRFSASLLFDPLLDVLLILAVALLLIGRRRRRAWIGPRRPRWGLRLAWLAWGAHWLASTPRFSFAALGLLEAPPSDVRAALGDTPEDRCVMIVLTGGQVTPRDGIQRAEMLAGSSLPRAIGAARVYHERPVGHVIVTGRGEPWGYPDYTAPGMADVMVAFGVPADRIVIEPLARTTRQNAQYSAFMVSSLGAEKVVLVSSAVHIPRSVMEFERVGLRVIPAPVDHRWEPPVGIAPYIPSIQALARTGQVIHELLGRFRP